MKWLNNLTLRAKLVSGFLFLVFIASLAIFSIPQFAFRQIEEEAIPIMALTLQISALVKTQQVELLTFVASGKQEDAIAFTASTQRLRQLLADMKNDSVNPMANEASFQDLIELVERKSTLGETIISAHTQTIGHLAVIQLLEGEIDDMFIAAQQIVGDDIRLNAPKSDLIALFENELTTQQKFGELLKQYEVVQVEAINYVTFGDPADKTRFFNAAREMTKILEALEPAFEGDKIGASELRRRLNRTSLRVKNSGVTVLENHDKTLETLTELKETEVALNQTLEQMQTLASAHVNAGISTANLNAIIVSISVLGIAGFLGFLMNNIISRPLDQLVAVAKQIGVGNLEARVPIETKDEMGLLAQSLNHMAWQLKKIAGEAERRTQKRIQTLERSANITRQMTIILNRDELLTYVVNTIQAEYQFYHTQIYLVDVETEDLLLAYGYGEVGKQLRAIDHQLSAGEGIVGTVASTNEHFLSNNVDGVLNFVPNALLPETKSELALPLRKQEQVLGVLDVQCNISDRFSPTDVAVLQSLANQIAVCLENIRLLEEAQETVKEVERLNARLSRQGWEQAMETLSYQAYRYIGDRNIVVPALEAVSASVNAQKNSAVPLTQNGVPQTLSESPTPSAPEVVVPLMVRGQMIGTVGVKKGEVSLSSEEKEVLRAVANQTSLALENARLSEEQGRTIVKLREVDRLKSEFLTSMSHELRTPLNSIIGFADILLQGIDGPLSDHAETDINAIHNSGKHLLLLINGLLDLSKIEAGRMELSCEALSIPRLAEEIVASSTSLLVNKPYAVRINISDDLPLVWADRLRINQILLNLVGNAIKFTDEGTVIIQAQVNTEGMMQVSVQDSGIGIPEDKFELVFEHFRQVDARTNRKYAGAGMGLAIAKQLTELHGGKMWLNSKLGEGSTFHFTIPLATEAQITVSKEEKS